MSEAFSLFITRQSQEVLATMGTTKGVDFEDFSDDEFEGDDFAFVEDAADRRRQQKARKSPKASWRSVEDYLENKRLKGQVSDVFDDE